VLNSKLPDSPCSPGGSLAALGGCLTRGGLGRPPFVELTWGKVASLGLGGKGDQGGVVSRKQSAGSSAETWACLPGGRPEPPTFAAPRGGALKKGNFPFAFFLFSFLAECRF